MSDDVIEIDPPDVQAFVAGYRAATAFPDTPSHFEAYRQGWLGATDYERQRQQQAAEEEEPILHPVPRTRITPQRQQPDPMREALVEALRQIAEDCERWATPGMAPLPERITHQGHADMARAAIASAEQPRAEEGER